MKAENHPAVGFLPLLASIAREAKSGVVQCAAKSGKRLLFFHKGLLKMISIPGGSHPLKRALLEEGLFSEEIMKQMKEKVGTKIKPDVLLKELNLDKRQAGDKVKSLLEKEFYTLLITPVDEFHFKEGEETYRMGIEELAGWEQSIAPEPLLILPMRRAKEWDFLDQILPSPLDVYFINPGSPFEPRAQNRGEEGDLRRFVNGERDVDEITALSGKGSFEARHQLYRLEMEGKIRRATEGELVYVAVQYQNKGRMDKCLRLYKRAEELGSEIFDLPLTIGRQYEAMGLRDEAISRYFQFAYRCQAKKLADRAISSFRRVLFLHEGNLDARENLFQLLLLGGKPEEIRKEGKILARSYLERKNREKAVKILTSTVESGSGDKEVFQMLIHEMKEEKSEKEIWQTCRCLVDKLDQDKCYEDAGILLEIFLKAFPFHREARRLLGENCEKRKKPEQAFEQYEEILRQIRESAGDQTLTFDDELAGLYCRMTRLNREFIEGHKVLLEWHLSRQERDKAVHHLEALKEIYRKRENLRELSGVMEQLMELRPGERRERMELADILIKAGRLERGIDTYLSIVDPDFLRSDRSEAERVLRKVLFFSPLNVRANHILAEMYLKEGLFLEVKDILERIVLASRGRALWKEAAWAFSELVRIHPEETYFYRCMAEAHFRGGEAERGREVLENLALKNMEQNNFGLAREICSVLLREDPENRKATDLLNKLAFGCSTSPLPSKERAEGSAGEGYRGCGTQGGARSRGKASPFGECTPAQQEIKDSTRLEEKRAGEKAGEYGRPVEDSERVPFGQAGGSSEEGSCEETGEKGESVETVVEVTPPVEGGASQKEELQETEEKSLASRNKRFAETKNDGSFTNIITKLKNLKKNAGD